MVLEKINNEKLLIIFSKEDMRKFNIDYENPYSGKYEILRLIREVLFLARVKTGFNSGNHKINVEMINKNQNCYVTATVLSIKGENKVPKTYKIKQNIKNYVYSFDTLEDLLCLTERLYKMKADIFSSKVLEQKNKYFMIIKARGIEIKRITPVLSEYGKLTAQGNASIARYSESSNVVIEDKAVHILGSQFSQ